MVQDGKVIDRQVFGLANEEKLQAADDDTIYHWASITKTFTAIAIMQLRDRGRLKLDDPIVDFVPELSKVRDQFGSIREITVRQLLSHTAGFRSRTFLWRAADADWQPPEPTEWSQIVAMLPYTEVEFKPGTRYGYSNLGYVFLGHVIERLSGEDYEVYVDKNILRPLGMTRSYFDTTPYFMVKHRSHSYRRNADDTVTPLRFDMDSGVTVSNGGLNAPLLDMAKYTTFLIGDTKNEVYDFVLKRSSLEEMWRPVIRKNTSPTSATLSDDIWVGLGFSVEGHFGARYIGHAGEQNGFIPHFYVQPQKKVGYVAAFNTELIWQRRCAAGCLKSLKCRLGHQYRFRSNEG